MQEEAILQELGLDQREAKIYLTLLKLSSTTAAKIAENIGIDRTTTYDVLSRMGEKGIISYVKKNNVKYFQAIQPEQLMQDLKQKQNQLENIMPNLLALSQFEKEETSVEIFKGKEGMISLLKMILRDKKEYLFLGGGHDFCITIPIFMKQFINRAEKLGLKGKLIVDEGFGNSPDYLV